MIKRRNNARRLRNSVAAMPVRTKEAMLRGIRTNRVIVGAYVDKRGGVCPMLAAHRNGGRTNFGTFARAWDAFTGANQRKPRRASRREVRTLEGYLEISLLRDGPAGADPINPSPPGSRGGAGDRGPAVRGRSRHRLLRARRRPGRPRPGLRRGPVSRASPHRGGDQSRRPLAAAKG